MKKLLFLILMVIVGFKVSAQDTAKVTLEGLNLKYEKEMGELKTNLSNCHLQYKKGTYVIGVGIGLTVVGAILTTCSMSANHPDNQMSMLYAGAGIAGGGTLLTFIGWIVQCDSHRFLMLNKPKRCPKIIEQSIKTEGVPNIF